MDLYEEAELPGKGCGVIAVRDIQVGELILSERPAIVLPWWIRHSQYPGREKRDFLKSAFQKLSQQEQKKYFALHDSKIEEGEAKTIDGIWRTNNFALGPSGSKTNNGLFLDMSRFNHSCVPYAEFHWNEKKGRQEVRAVRFIPRGEEITICYFTIQEAVHSQYERKEYLKNSYGFPCDCTACNLKGEDRVQNDLERAEVGRLGQEIEDLLYYYPSDGNSSCSDDDLDSVGEAIRLGFLRLNLMDKLGFKVISQIRQCQLLYDTGAEWEMPKIMKSAAARGHRLAVILHGESDPVTASWLLKLKSSS